MKLERTLTEIDKALLGAYKFKCQQVKDFTVACLAGTHTGMLLFGAGGNGKSFSVRETLQEREIREIRAEDTNVQDDEADNCSAAQFGFDTWINHQGRITPKGLVTQLDRYPQSLHLVEDAETMFDDRNCWGVLRMALHSQDQNLHSQRRITWAVSSRRDSYDFNFTGSLIIVGNRVLSDKMQEIEAVKTRCPTLNFEISNAELVAKMKELSCRGYRDIASAQLDKNDCYDVLDFILEAIESDPDLKRDPRGKEKKLNLRLLISGFRFMALGKMEPSINWKDLLLSQMKQLVGASRRTLRDRISEEVEIAKEITSKRWKSQHEKLVEWCRLTGRDGTWAEMDHESDEYKKGFNSAKTDLARKSKR